MKIVYDNIAFNLQKAGGVSLYWYEILKRILRDKKNVTFIEQTEAHNNIFRKDVKLDNVIMEQTIKSSLLRYLPVTERIESKSVFHSSYYRICVQKDVINFTTIHDFTYEYFRTGLPKWINYFQKKLAISKADGIICISENTKKDLLKFHPWAQKKNIKVIYNGVSDDYFKIDSIFGSELYNKYRTRKFIIFVGSREEYKNFQIVIELLAKAKEYDLIIIGGKDLNQQEKFQLENKAKNRYEHLKGLNNQELNILYNLAFCLIYPSSYEGFGIPPLEAMKAGCPVITTNLSSIPEVVGDAAILVKKVTVDDFYKGLTKLENKEYRNELINKGFSQANKFSWEKTYQEIFYFYEEVYNQIFQD